MSSTTFKNLNLIIKLSHILYFSNQVCQWKITAPQGSIVQIKVVDFFLEDSESCISDNVIIYDGKSISQRTTQTKPETRNVDCRLYLY